MGLFDGNTESGAMAHTGKSTTVPEVEFLPPDLMNMEACNNEGELEAVKGKVSAFAKVAQLTNSKFNKLKQALDIALKMSKRRDQHLKDIGNTHLNQVRSATDAASFLMAVPSMAGLIKGQVGNKASKRVQRFTERITAAADK